MLPALLLDATPAHSVLDMCASPGSKTRQILEAMQPGMCLKEFFLIKKNGYHKIIPGSLFYLLKLIKKKSFLCQDIVKKFILR